MSRSRSRVNVAFVEDCEGSDSGIEGNARSRVYAMSEAPDSPSPPPAKEIPNTGKSRSEKYRPRRGTSSASSSDDTGHSSRKGRSEKRERDTRESRKKEAERQEELRKRDKREERRQKAIERAQRESTKALKKVRPSGPKHSATQPIMSQQDPRSSHEDPTAYGVPQYGPPGSRPRASTRPASYYSGQSARPPPSATGFPPGHGPPPPPSPFPVGTFPPPMYPMMPPPPSSMHSAPPSRSPGGMSAYFENGPPPSFQGRDLRSRFETRPSSALGFSPSGRSYLQDQYGYDDEPTHRPPTRTSRTKKHEGDDDRKQMPPPSYIPMRPRTTANSSTPFNPPPPRPASRHGRTQSRSKPCRRAPGYGVYEDDDFLGDEGLYQDIMPDNNSYDSRRMALSRPQHRRDSMYEDDDDEEYGIVPSGHMSRRGSVYGSHALGSGGVSLDGNKYMDALRYQDDVTGVSPLPLTAETLRKANRRGEVASSRSTRSSGSHDDSEYKRSNTTGFTQSSNGEDFTIKVSGAAVVRLGNAEIECEDSEITFSNGMPRFGSDQASTIYQLEDSRSRVERKALPHRPRAPSQSDVRSRGYAPSHAPYDSPFQSYYG